MRAAKNASIGKRTSMPALAHSKKRFRSLNLKANDQAWQIKVLAYVSAALVLLLALDIGLWELQNASNNATAQAFLDLNFSIYSQNALVAGLHGYWSIANYTRNVSIVQLSKSNYSVNVITKGAWKTVAGARSPNHGIFEKQNGSGIFYDNYSEKVSGSFIGPKNISGFEGNFIFNGTFSDLLNYSLNPTPNDMQGVPWESAYFSGNITILYANVIFIYENQTYSLTYNSLNYTGFDVSGDIIT